MAATTSNQLGEFGGSVLTPDTPGFDRARRVWNAMVDRMPRLQALWQLFNT